MFSCFCTKKSRIYILFFIFDTHSDTYHQTELSNKEKCSTPWIFCCVLLEEFHWLYSNAMIIQCRVCLRNPFFKPIVAKQNSQTKAQNYCKALLRDMGAFSSEHEFSFRYWLIHCFRETKLLCRSAARSHCRNERKTFNFRKSLSDLCFTLFQHAPAGAALWSCHSRVMP